jgi:hypothetical protein
LNRAKLRENFEAHLDDGDRSRPLSCHIEPILPCAVRHALEIVATEIGGYIQLLIFHFRHACRMYGRSWTLCGMAVLR